MSLLIWLPLTGDVHNQGLLNCTPVQTNGSWETNGKLGKAFNSGDGGFISLNTSITLNNKFSFACWVKVNVRKTWGTAFSMRISDNEYMGLCCNGDPPAALTLGFHIYSNVNGTRTKVLDQYVFPVNLSEWNHIAVTIDGTTAKYYMNGTLKGTYTMTKAINLTYTNNLLGKGGNLANDSINDFRIYDHVLSPKEVKEIAKGLVVHYPLSREGFGGDNIINGTSSTEVQYTYPSTSFNDFYNRKTTIVPSASQYILSFDAKSTVAGDKIRAHYYNPNTTTRCESSQGIVNTASDGNMDFTLSTEWERYWVVYTQSSTTAAKNVILPRMCSKASGLAATGSGTVSIKRVKFEEGDKPTPWIPNQSDTAYTAMGLNDDVVYDTSGFSYNATKSGTFEYTSDTPKYLVSTKLLTTSSKIRLPEISFTGMANSYTFSWWQYYNGGGTMPWGFSNGNRLNFYHCSPVCWNTGDGANNPFKNGSTTLPPANLQNAWHHIAVTGDGTTTKLYIDGEYFGNATTYRPITGTQIWISGWDSGTSYTFSGGKLSDFRIYATCLSASDIQQLYNTPISLANNGTLFANELTEV